MSRITLAAAAAVFVAAAVYTAPAGTQPPAQPKDAAPDLGFDYRALIRERMNLIGEGKGDKALEVLERRALGPGTLGEADRDFLRKKYAAVFGTGGGYLGHETAGSERLGSRFVRVYTAAYFEESVTTTTHLFVKNPDDRWKFSTLTISDGVNELDAATPLTPLPAAKD